MSIHLTVLWRKKSQPNTSKSLSKTVSRIFFQDYMRSNGKSQSLSEGSFALFQPSCPSDLNKLTTIKQGWGAWKGECPADRVWVIVQSNNSISGFRSSCNCSCDNFLNASQLFNQLDMHPWIYRSSFSWKCLWPFQT